MHDTKFDEISVGTLSLGDSAVVAIPIDVVISTLENRVKVLEQLVESLNYRLSVIQEYVPQPDLVRLWKAE